MPASSALVIARFCGESFLLCRASFICAPRRLNSACFCSDWIKVSPCVSSAAWVNSCHPLQCQQCRYGIRPQLRPVIHPATNYVCGTWISLRQRVPFFLTSDISSLTGQLVPCILLKSGVFLWSVKSNCSGGIVIWIVMYWRFKRLWTRGYSLGKIGVSFFRRLTLSGCKPASPKNLHQ